ncbi:RNA polymerase sigma factor [Cohnella yongneupensis]|uniref:RNA polymerase sigma factor n=1 Tax=Cohnella yongneupensis TaxID=425006 RepID=A0ABW0QWJ4_9BACL
MDVNEPLQPLSAERIEALVKDVQGGQAESYRALVLHFQRRMQLYCHHMIGDRTEFEDAVQEIFVKAYREIAKYRPTVSFSAWLYKIAYRHCLNVLKQRQGHQRLLSLMTLQWPSAPPPRTAEAAHDLVASQSLTYKSTEEVSAYLSGNMSRLKLPGDVVGGAKLTLAEVLPNTETRYSLPADQWVKEIDSESGTPYAYFKNPNGERRFASEQDSLRFTYADNDTTYQLGITYGGFDVTLYDIDPSTVRIHEVAGVQILRKKRRERLRSAPHLDRPVRPRKHRISP